LLSSARSLPCDILHFARHVPVARAEAEFDLRTVAAARAAASTRISWTVLFVRAHALVAQQHLWLRQTWMRFPVPHVYQHARSVAMVAVSREHQGQPRLCFARLMDPASSSLHALQSQLDRYAQGPVDEVYRKQLRLSRFPWPVRRLMWWLTLSLSGRIRERQTGTFSLSSLAGRGVNNRDHPTLCTSSLSYGPLDERARGLVTLIYDHRLADGAQASDVLWDLERRLNVDLVSELRSLPSRQAA
jgi:hypothetical protein